MNPTHKEMALQAVRAHGGRATFAEIKDYIRNHLDPVNEGSFNCSVNSCSVNLQSRVNYLENQKARVCQAGKGYDLFFKIGSGPRATYELYDPAIHGQWEIAELRSSGKAAERWTVRKVGQEPKLPEERDPPEPPPQPPAKQVVPAQRQRVLGAAELGKLRRRLMALLDEFDTRLADEGPGVRISRLSHARKVPRHVAKLMGVVVEYRNFAEYENGVLSPAESELVLSACKVIDEWSAARGYHTRLCG